MERKDLDILFRQFLADDELSEVELQRLFDYFSLDGNRDRLRQLILEELHKGAHFPIGDDLPRFQRVADEVESELRLRILGQRDSRIKSTLVRVLIRFSIAASLLIGLSIGIYYYFATDLGNTGNLTAERDDILPGRNRALLTLANGKVVDLNEASGGIIAKQQGLQIKKQVSGAIVYEQVTDDINVDESVSNTVTTPRGGRYQVTLPDGTDVWLNAASSLTYPVAFQRSVRIVELVGEAYFEVTEDKERPFIVNSGDQSITVLGTAFNVFAYANESAVVTTLVEGAVSVQYGGDEQIGKVARKERRLTPGQQAILSGQQMRVTHVNTSEYTAWKEGIISFQDKDFNTIIRQIERWYDVTFEPRGISVTGRLSGMVFSDVKLSELLQALSVHTAIKFEIKGRRVIMQP